MKRCLSNNWLSSERYDSEHRREKKSDKTSASESDPKSAPKSPIAAISPAQSTPPEPPPTHTEEPSYETLESLFETSFSFKIKNLPEKILITRSDRPGISAKIIYSQSDVRNTSSHPLVKVESVFCKEEMRGMGLGKVLFSELFKTLRLDDSESDEVESSSSDNASARATLAVKRIVALEAEEDMERHNKLVKYYQGMGFVINPDAKIQFLNHNDQATYRKIPMSLSFDLSAPLKKKVSEDHSFLMVRLLYDDLSGPGEGSDSRKFSGLVPDPGDIYDATAQKPSEENEEAKTNHSKPDSKSESPDDTWVIVQVGVGKFLFKTLSGLHMCSEPDGRIVADRSEPDRWECFHLVKSNRDEKKLVFKTFHNTYVTVDEDQRLCTSRTPMTWKVGDLSLRCNGTTDALKSHYRSWWGTQTMEYARKMREQFSKFELGQFSILEVLDILKDVPFDPLVLHGSTSSLRSLSFYISERARKAGEPDWVQLVCLIFGLGQIVRVLDKKEGKESEKNDGVFDWTLECQSRIVGCSAPSFLKFQEFRGEDPDVKNPDFMTDNASFCCTGICGESVDENDVSLSWSGPEYIHAMVLHNKTTLPPCALILLRLLNLDTFFKSTSYDIFSSSIEASLKPLICNIHEMRSAAKRACHLEMDDKTCDDLWNCHYLGIAEKYNLGGILSW